jgi:energy-coupling factor transport system ATP-binding protein
MQQHLSVKVATAAILIALGVVLSWVNPFAYYPPFGIKINPFVHMINVIAGLLLGPVYALLVAFGIAILRFSFGLGTILAFPGGLSGALIVGVVRELIVRVVPKLIRRIEWAALVEPIGTVFIGATISSLLVPTPIWTLWWLFACSCIPGAIIGGIIVSLMYKRGLVPRPDAEAKIPS